MKFLFPQVESTLPVMVAGKRSLCLFLNPGPFSFLPSCFVLQTPCPNRGNVNKHTSESLAANQC